MTLNQLQTYIVGVLQGYFPNKAVLDKLSEGTDGTLLFDGQPISGEALVTDAELQQAITNTLAELGITDEEIEANVGSFAALKTVIANGATLITVTEPLAISEDAVLEAEEPIKIIANGIVDAFTVTGGTLTLGKNISITTDTAGLWANGGNIVVDGANIVGSSAEMCIATVSDDSEMLVKSGSIVSTGNSVAVALGTNAKMTIEGGLVETTAEISEAGRGWCAAYAGNGGIVEVTGGTLQSTNGHGLVAVTNGTVKVSGGTVDSVLSHEAKTAKAEISGGTIGMVMVEDGASAIVTGGVFDTDPSVYVPDGYTVLNSNDTYSVIKNV